MAPFLLFNYKMSHYREKDLLQNISFRNKKSLILSEERFSKFFNWFMIKHSKLLSSMTNISYESHFLIPITQVCLFSIIGHI